MDSTSTLPGIAPSAVTAWTAVPGAAIAAGTIASPIGPKRGLIAGDVSIPASAPSSVCNGVP